jgi:hypothetical protein
LVTYRELEQEVWKGPVSESALYQQLATLRKILGDNPNKPTFIKTVSRRGYQFIGELRITRTRSDNLLTHILRKLVAHRRLWQITLAVLATASAVTAFIFISKPAAPADILTDLIPALHYPERIVALEVLNADARKPAGLFRCLELIIEHHLDQSPDQHVVRIPQFSGDNSYQKLAVHFSRYGKFLYVLRPEIEEAGDGQLLLSVNITNPQTRAPVERLSLIVPAAEAVIHLPAFERLLVDRLKALGLLDGDRMPALAENAESNQSILEAASILERQFLDTDNIRQAINHTLRAIDLNPDNLMPYNFLWDEIYWLVNFESEYNIDVSLATLKSRAEYAHNANPGHYKPHYMLAEYYYWTQNYV